MRRHSVFILVAVLIASLLASHAAADLTVSSWGLQLNARDTTLDTASAPEVAVVLPFSVERTAATQGGTVGTARYDFSVSGNTGSFGLEFDFHRTGVIDSQVSGAGNVYFQVTENFVFDLDGLFNLDGSGRIRADVIIRDLTIGGGQAGFIYRSLQQSLDTTDEVFQLGDLGGDDTNSQLGTLPGILVPGHEYLLDYYFDIITPAGGDSGASANGFLNLNISVGKPEPVPAPSVFLLGILGLGVAGRRLRKHRC